MKRKLQILCILFFSVYILSAEDNDDKPSYHKGKILTELSFGSLASEISARSSPNTLTSLYFLYDVRPLLLSSNTESYNLGIYKYASFEKPEIENYNSRLAVEYAVFDWLGIGVSASATKFRISKITPGNYLSYPALYIPPPLATGNVPMIDDYLSFNRQEFKINFATIDIEASIHYPYKSLDPYFRIGYGATPGFPGVFKSSLAGGIRLFFEDSFVQMEYIQNFLYGIKLEQTDYLRERGVRFGIGYSWF